MLDQILVGAVTSRPLTLDEIRTLGIQFDENSFQAFSFTIALTTSSGVVKIDLPALVPLNGQSDGMMVGGEIPGFVMPQLPGLDLPNLEIQPIMLEAIGDDLPSGVTLPRIPGIIVIPGNVAFLNQFFSVLLSVTNQAPNGTPLVVRDVRAEIKLPPGADGTAGDITRDPPFPPGAPEFDNPLRIAKTAHGRQNIRPVLAAGPDGEPGTADDVDRLAPQKSGTAEFLVEAVREGGHVVDIEITGVLEGLPSGPVKVSGRARGAVVVRDPNFSLTFIHPDTVRAGTRYDLLVQIQNTSQVAANLVTVSLDAANLSGARLCNPADGSQTIETIPAGGSATITLCMEALRTGRVTASTLQLSNEGGIVTGRHLAFRTGVSELGVPLSPDTLILPPVVSLLRERAANDDLTFRAIALLGEAHSIATAPRGSLPPGIQPIPNRTVTLRAHELIEAALRLKFSVREGSAGAAEPIPEGLLLTLQDLYFDFLGAGMRENGWDVLYRQSRQARLFGAALAEVIERQRGPLGLPDLLALQRSWGQTESYRPDHLTLMTHSTGGTIPVVMELRDSLSRRLGGSLDPEGGVRQIPGADILTFDSSGISSGQFAVLTQIAASPYTASFTAMQSGSFDLGVVVHGSDGQLRHVTFRGVHVSAGEVLTATIRPRQSPLVALTRNGVPPAAGSEDVIPDTPPRVLGVMQHADPSVDLFGRVVAVLFDEDIELASGQDAASYSISPATVPMIPGPSLVDSNLVRQALAQLGRRIVLVGLRDPVGPFVRRTLDIAGVRDLRGQSMDPVVARRILPDPDIGAGGQVTGRIVKADGSAVPTPQITYRHWVPDPVHECLEHTIAVKPGDDEGRYGFDFVPKNPCGDRPFRIRARDPSTGEEGELRSGIAANGQRISLDIVLVGRGSVQGTVRRPDGTPQPDVTITVTSENDSSGYTARTDQNGFYRITGVAVGGFALEARGSAGSARASGVIARSGAAFTLDVTIFGPAEGAIAGAVRYPDGSSAPGIDVFIEEADRFGFLARTTTDAAGTFRIDRVAAGSYRARAIVPAAALIGEALLSVTDQHTAGNPAFVLVLLSGTGSVSGTVREIVNGVAIPVPGALVAGGLEIATADAEGRYSIPAVPVGQRLIEAMNPQTGARGSRAVTILTAGQASQGIDIVLQPLARVTGRVLTPDGEPLGSQEVRILVGEGAGAGGGRIFFVRKTQSAPDGTFQFDQLEPRSYTLMAMRGNEVANTAAVLSPLVMTAVVELRLVRPTGRVSGRAVDATGLAVAAQVALKARVPNPAGILEFREAGTTTSNPDTGFSFGNLFPGPFALTASSFFSPTVASASGVLTEGNPVAENITLVLANNTGLLRGCVLAPDGSRITPILDGTGVPLPVSVFITSLRLRNELAEDDQNPEPDGIRVDASGGCFVSSIPLPPDFYTIEVTDDRTGSPTFGLRGQAHATVQQGVESDQDVRLLGLGSVVVDVVDGSGNSLPGVAITMRRTTFPSDHQEAFATVPTGTTPVRFDQVTEGPVSVSAVVSTDPAVNVGGRDDLRGFGGNAIGTVVRDGALPIRVVIDAAGVVTGRFLRTDGATAVPNAQVQLDAGGRPALYDVTGVNGMFRFTGVPRGSFTLTGFDASTGRRAEATGRVEIDGQIATRDLVLGPLGRVHGVVLDADRTRPIAGAEVRLSIAGLGARVVTAGADGTFAFESVPGGTFTATAVSPNGLSGLATGTLESEGQDVPIEIVLEQSGRVEGIARDALGVPAAAAHVSLIDQRGVRRTVQAGAGASDAGRFAFDAVPLGAVTVEARPQGALTPGDGGRSTGTLSTGGHALELDVLFQGTLTIGAIVSGQVGAAPVDVALDSSGFFGGRAAPTGVQNGVYLFEGIPRASFTLSAKQNTPAGTTISASAPVFENEGLPPPGGRITPDIELILSPVATVRGFVRLPAGPGAAGVRITLTAGNFTSLTLSAADGSFEFVGVPTDVDLRLEMATSTGGRATFIGSIDENAIVRDENGNPVAEIISIVDTERPTVVSTVPPSGTGGVPTDTTIVVTFSEPIDPATLRACSAAVSAGPVTVHLLESTGAPPVANDPSNPCDDSNVALVATALSADRTILTITPIQPLRDLTQHRLILSAPSVDEAGNPAGGIRDRAGLALATDSVSQFVTRDNLPPAVLTISPADGALDVSRESLVRITFNEPLDPASIGETSISVTGPAGPVAGRRDSILGNTVVVFTPTGGGDTRAFLASDATYTVTVQGVRDVAGNVQVPPIVAASFRTIDTIAPVVGSLSGPPGARHGQSIELRALTNDADVSSVEFFTDGTLSARISTPSAPGEYRTTLVMPERPIQVSARGIDTSGNVGPLAAPLTIGLLADDPPSAAVISPAADTSISPGVSIPVTVSAQDDVGVAAVKVVVSGAVSLTATRAFDPPVSSVEATFDVAVPADAPGGSFTVAAVATDTRQQSGEPGARTFVVSDDIDPAVTIEAPTAGTVVLPGTSVTVTIHASDAGRVAAVLLDVPELAYSQSAAIVPVASSVTRTFVVPVPASFAGGALTLTASARDRFGRTGTSTLAVPVLTAFAVESLAARGAALDQTRTSANANQSVRITGLGLAGSLVVRFQSTSDEGVEGTVTAPLFGVNPEGTEASVVVPSVAVTGIVRVETATGAQASAQPFLQIVPTIDSLAVPAGQAISPGVVATFTGSGFREGATRVEFPGAGAVQAVDVTNGNTRLSVVVPEGLAAGDAVVVTDGGRSNGFPVLGTFGLTGTAALGTPANLQIASANIGQTITVTGENLSTSLVAVFTSADETGALTTVEAPLGDVTAPGTQAFVVVPSGAVTGPVTLRPQGGVVFTAPVPLQIVPTLDSYQVPAGTTALPGTTLTLSGSGFFEGSTTVAFENAATVAAADVSGNGTTLTVIVPVGFDSGVVRAITAGGSSNEIEIEAIDDGTAPAVVAISPANGATDVPLDVAVRATFSKPVDASTVTSSTFQLIEDAASPVSRLVTNGSFDADAAAWTFANIDGAGGWFATGGNPGGYFILNHNGGATDPTISQSISGLVAGQRYRLRGQFLSVYSSFGDPAALSFGVEVDGSLLGELRRPPEGAWQDFVFEFTASATSMTVSFSAERNGDDSSYGVDNVVLEPLVTGSVVLAPGGLTATLTPSAPLHATRIYRVEVSGVADAAGTVMTAPFVSTFSTIFAVGADADGDGYPDVVEHEVGSDPQDPSSTPVSITPAVGESVSSAFSVLNRTSSSDTADPSLFVGDATSAAFSVLNATSLADATDPALAVTEAISPSFAVLNGTNLTGTDDPAAFIGEAVSRAFAVLNTTSLSGAIDPALAIGEAVSPFFVVANGATANGAAAAAATAGPQRLSPTLDAAPIVSITSIGDGSTIFSGQTLRVLIDAKGSEGLMEARLAVNGVVLAEDRTAPYAFTFTVPANVTALTFQASVRSAQNATGWSGPVNVSVVPDPRTTLSGRLVDSDGRPVAGAAVTVALNGLKAEFIDFVTPLTALPDLTGSSPTRTGHVSAVNVRNPDGLFGTDPFGAGMSPDYAVRYSGLVAIDQPGRYTFVLAADEGARLTLAGETVIQMPAGNGEFRAFSRTVELPAALVPIEVTYYESIGDAELQLLYAREGMELEVVPPDRLRTIAQELTVRTGNDGQFVIRNVPANVAAIRLTDSVRDLSIAVAPVPGGTTDLGDIVIER